MTEPRRSSSRIDTLRHRAADGIYRSITLILDDIERRQEARDKAWRRASCMKTACRRARRCRGSGFDRGCEQA